MKFVNLRVHVSNMSHMSNINLICNNYLIFASVELHLACGQPGLNRQAWGGHPEFRYNFPPNSQIPYIPVRRRMQRVHVATRWILWGPTICVALAEESALHRIILCAMRFTTSFASRASTRIGSARASFLHRLLGGAEGVSIL